MAVRVSPDVQAAIAWYYLSESDRRRRKRRRDDDEEDTAFAETLRPYLVREDNLEAAFVLKLRRLQAQPGKGHRLNDAPPLVAMLEATDAQAVRHANHALNNCDKKCISIIGMNPAEFTVFYDILSAYVDTNYPNQRRRTNNNNGGRVMKLALRERLFILFYALISNETLARLEFIFQWSSTSIDSDLKFLIPILVKACLEEVEGLWPSAAERAILSTLVPEILQGQGIFCSVDGTKMLEQESTDSGICKRGYSANKGFGPTVQVVCDTLGRLIGIEVFPKGGHQNDSTTYRTSNMYNQQGKFQFGIDERVLGDGNYITKSSCRLNSTMILTAADQPTLAAIRRTGDADLIKFADTRNDAIKSVRSSVETVIRGIKQQSYCGDRSLIRHHAELSNDTIVDRVTLSAIIHAILQRMRGQCHNSDQAIVLAPVEGVQFEERLLNLEMLGERNCFTHPGRKNRFYGPALSGVVRACPPPLPL